MASGRPWYPVADVSAVKLGCPVEKHGVLVDAAAIEEENVSPVRGQIGASASASSASRRARHG